MPIVRSPWTLEWPRTGQAPAPGLPSMPRKSRKLATSCTSCTPCLCCVSPIAQQQTGRATGWRFPAAERTVCAESTALGDEPESDSLARFAANRLEAAGVLLDEGVIGGGGPD